MEENKDIIIENKGEKEEEIKKGEYNGIKNEEDEKNQLLNEKDKNEELNIINKDKNENIKETLINNNDKIEINNNNIDNNINNNIENKNKNLMITDYLITIQYSKIFHIPYFFFGNMINFFPPCHKFEKKKINLSQMPTPPFAIVITQCK